MPDKRAHRGPHPEDPRLFAAGNVPRLREAVADYSWLLTRHYADTAALRIVGDHFQLHQRQRIAVMRCGCPDQALYDRRARLMPPEALAGCTLLLDGYNVLTTVEAALAHGAIFRGRDGCLRDVASMHGSYRKVRETVSAIVLIGQTMQRLGVSRCAWLLDAPVSNSGRLKTILLHLAKEHQWSWSVQVVPSPDHLLISAAEPIVTADSVVLDRGGRWSNLARLVVESSVPEAWVVDLGV